MSNLGDDLFATTIKGMILGLPLIIGIAVLAISIAIISCIIDVPGNVVVKNLLIFAAAVFLVWLFSRFQIIENGIVGLIVGMLVHKNFAWHSVACIMIAVTIISVLFFISYIKIGFWIKTIIFSIIVTFLVFMCIYSDVGLFPMQDNVWKTVFAIIFFLENIFIRCATADDNVFLSVKKSSNVQGEQSDIMPQENKMDLKTGEAVQTPERTAVEPKEDFDYLTNRVNMFFQKDKFWDGEKGDDNIERKIYQMLQTFIDDDYIILPHVGFREIFWWGQWKDNWRLTNRVTKMHFDFGIYNKELQPIFFLEIQGKDHKTDLWKMESDKFKAAVMERCKLKLITLDCSEPMADSEIRDKLISCIKEEIPDRQSCATYCPSCRKQGKNERMTIKLGEKGYFYGCSTYAKENSDNCSGISIKDVPALYRGMPIIKKE